MSQAGPRIAFLGTPAVAVPTLCMLASSRQLQTVFCNPDRPQGRGRQLEAPPVKQAASEFGLPVQQPESWKMEETKGLWLSLGIDLAIVVAYGHILPRWMLDSCSLGVWNLHFSLLPRWRGASPVNHAILAGDDSTGVSLMRITPGLDAGPVLAMSKRPINLEDTAEGLLSRLADDASGLLHTHLEELRTGSASPLIQDEASVTIAPKLTKEMAVLDFSRSALELHRQVRALQPWPGVEFTLQDSTLQESIVKIHAVGGLRPCQDAPGTLSWGREGAWLAAGDGQAMELVRLQRPGKPIQPSLQALQPWGAQGSVNVG